MSHLDEGMIHSWLDGELSPLEGAALEAHAAECAACAALVAEARGLMAASTRLLDALDNVPVGVIPQGASATSTTVPQKEQAPGHEAVARPVLGIARGTETGERTVPARTRRPLYRHPQFAAAAALVIVAIGTWTVRQRTSQDAAQRSPQVMNEARAPGVSQVMDSAAVGPVASAADGREKNALIATAPLQRARARSEQVVNAPDAAAAKASLDKLPSTPVPSAALADEARRDVTSRRAELAAAAPPMPARAPAAGAGRVSDAARADAAKLTSEPKRLALSPDALVAKERDRLAGELKTQAQGARQAAANEPSRSGQVVTTGAAGAGAGGGIACYDLARSAAALEERVPPRVQLLETAGPTTGERVWKQVRVPGDAPGTGEWFWWARPDGALLLARIEGSAVRYEVPITAPAAREVRAYTTKCP